MLSFRQSHDIDQCFNCIPMFMFLVFQVFYIPLSPYCWPSSFCSPPPTSTDGDWPSVTASPWWSFTSFLTSSRPYMSSMCLVMCIPKNVQEAINENNVIFKCGVFFLSQNRKSRQVTVIWIVYTYLPFFKVRVTVALYILVYIRKHANDLFLELFKKGDFRFMWSFCFVLNLFFFFCLTKKYIFKLRVILCIFIFWCILYKWNLNYICPNDIFLYYFV